MMCAIERTPTMLENLTIPTDLNEEQLRAFFKKAYLHQDCTLEELKEEVLSRLLTEQNKIVEKNAADLAAGKYKDVEDMKARMPLFRDGDKLINIPKDILVWYAFMGWINSVMDGEIML